MLQTTHDLIATAYRYFPRGIPFDDPAYKQTEEHCRLVEARRKAGTQCELWRAMLTRLGNQFPEHDIHDGALRLPTGRFDSSYSGRIYLPAPAGERTHMLDFQVSFLVPYYIVYSSRLVDDLEAKEAAKSIRIRLIFKGDTCYVLPAGPGEAEIDKNPDMPFLKEVLSFEWSPDELPYAAWIAGAIEETWGYERMPPEVGKIIVPEAATDRHALGEATLYDCLLSCPW